MAVQQDHCFVITGGPGAGKTTLIDALRARGEICLPESARHVLQTEMLRTGQRPTPEVFCRYTLLQDVAEFQRAGLTPIRTFFDRGIVDVAAASKIEGVEVKNLTRAIETYRYNRAVFIAPPWKDIFTQDTERVQTWDQAVSSYEACAQAYADAGYDLIELPRTDISRRLSLIYEATVVITPLPERKSDFR